MLDVVSVFEDELVDVKVIVSDDRLLMLLGVDVELLDELVRVDRLDDEVLSVELVADCSEPEDSERLLSVMQDLVDSLTD